MHPDIEITPNGRAIFDDELDAFEARHGISLPADYREFMLTSNGCLVSPEVELLHSGNGYNLFQIFSLNDNAPDDLDCKCRSSTWEEAYSLGCLCFARDYGGSRFFIATRGRERGAIYFVDREELLNLGVVRVADSFRQLMDGLVPL